MCSHKPPLLKSHNKPKISFKNHFTKSVLKTWSTQTALTYNIVHLNRHKNKMCSNNNHFANRVRVQ